ncbi:MAG: hypothetical protein [Wendovervirus sonii]|uniref:Uncharacterized protein n=1 Tax=phage Lak_Megaphage_Sonny TaxID=3109229 RepID=A0ABZ0Z351_9CAUD|nr:MAG: hypothetical protein [phage Lak_Megaphage_Sonny]
MKTKRKFTDLPFAEQDLSKTVKFYVDAKKKTVACVIYDRMYDMTYTGITHCHDCDTFDERIGRAIAFNKARKKELTSNIKFAQSEKERFMNFYKSYIENYERREKINNDYLAEVNKDLESLMS